MNPIYIYQYPGGAQVYSTAPPAMICSAPTFQPPNPPLTVIGRWRYKKVNPNMLKPTTRL